MTPQQQISSLIADRTDGDGLTQTAIPGVSLFRASSPVPCAPAVYEPSIIAIVNGSKEAVLDGTRHFYDSAHYLCCPMSMPVQAGTPNASAANPLLGVYIALDQRMMTALTLDLENSGFAQAPATTAAPTQGVSFARWDAAFSDALLRLLALDNSPADAAVLGQSRLREVYYAVLKGDAGRVARQAFGPGNAIARSIAHVSSHLDAAVSIDDLASRAGMSRAVFHRRFKQATTLSPIQFVKSMRLNSAAMKIASGMTVNEAALGVGYVSPSQFSREFKRHYGQSPRQWSDAHQRPAAVA